MSMSTKERGILVGLAIVLAVATAIIIIKAGAPEGIPPEDESQGGGFDERRLPAVENVVREFETPGGVRVLVLEDGEGEPVSKGQAMEIAYTGYHAASGAIFERGMRPSLVLARGGVIKGWLEGLVGINPHEKRRLFIPSALAYGARGQGAIRPNSDLVFDVQWVRLEVEDLKVGAGSEVARKGSRVLCHYVGTLPNGKIFDASHKHTPPDPLWLTLKTGRGGVIPGWAQGMIGMKVGGRRKMLIPWHLGYGDKGTTGIPAYADLTFVVELLDVE